MKHITDWFHEVWARAARARAFRRGVNGVITYTLTAINSDGG